MQMCEIPIRIARRRDAFIHLHDMHRVPRHILGRERSQHLPRRASAAHRQHELPACLNALASYPRDHRGRLPATASTSASTSIFMGLIVAGTLRVPNRSG